MIQQFEATVTKRGQVTIPLEIRHLMGLHPHDRISFEVEGDVVKIRRITSRILQGYGAVTPRDKPEHLRELREKFEKEVAEDVVSFDKIEGVVRVEPGE